MNEYKKITSIQFERLFRVKEFKGQWDCYGTWNGLDMYALSDTPENARIEMWQKLMKAGWAYTEKEESRIKTLLSYAVQCPHGKKLFGNNKNFGNE